MPAPRITRGHLPLNRRSRAKVKKQSKFHVDNPPPEAFRRSISWTKRLYGDQALKVAERGRKQFFGCPTPKDVVAGNHPHFAHLGQDTAGRCG